MDGDEASTMEFSSGIAFFFVAAILYSLLFSCFWCMKRMRLYNQTIREFENQERESRRVRQDPIYSVYTVERDRDMSQFYPPKYQEKDDLPTYEEALTHPTVAPSDTPNNSQTTSNPVTSVTS